MRVTLFGIRVLLGCFILALCLVQLFLLTIWQQSVGSSNENDNRQIQAISGCSSVLPAEIRRLIPQRFDDPSEKKPCALLFFGLAKQFRSIVLPSIQKYILDVSENGRCDIFVHNYNVTMSVNPRAGEHYGAGAIDPLEVYDLTKDENVVLETIEDFLRQRNMKFYAHVNLKPPRSLGWDRTAFENMYKQWHSIEKVWDRMKEDEISRGIEYDRVGLFRSDVQYATPIDIFDGDAVIPKFGFFVNDRMFYGKYEYARIWAKIRFPSVECYIPRHQKIRMHSEFFMNDLVLKNIPNVTKKDICFYRVRVHGDVWDDDCKRIYRFPDYLVKLNLTYN